MKLKSILSTAILILGLTALTSCGGSTSSSGSATTHTLGANETAATIPASIAATYNLTFTENTAGSGIANGTTTSFIVGTDGTLSIDGSLVLGDPYLYRGNAQEAIWIDDANGLAYSLSSLTLGFNEINVSINKNYDETGFIFYGQYR